MKSTSLETVLRDAFAARANIIVELTSLESLAPTTAAQLATLESNADLADTKSLAEITRLQTVNSLLPRRVAAKEQALIEAEASLLGACHDFIYKELNPLGRRIEDETRDRVKKSLQEHFKNADALQRAVSGSDAVKEIEQIKSGISVANPPPNQLPFYAQRLLDAVARLRELDITQPAAVAA